MPLSSAPEAGQPTFLASPKPGHGPIAKPPTTVRSRPFAIVGAGGIGVEVATAWQGLGASVSLHWLGDLMLPEWNRLWGNSSVADWPTPALCAWEYRSARWAAQTLAQWPSGWTTVPKLRVDEVLFATGRHREPTTSAGDNRTDAGQLAGRR